MIAGVWGRSMTRILHRRSDLWFDRKVSCFRTRWRVYERECGGRQLYIFASAIHMVWFLDGYAAAINCMKRK